MRYLDNVSRSIAPLKPSVLITEVINTSEVPVSIDFDGKPTLDPYQYPLKSGETLVVPHPHSGIDPYVIPTISSPSNKHNAARKPIPDEGGMPDDRPAWYPFRTMQDFKQAKIFVQGNTPDSQINRQLEYIHTEHGSGKLTMRTARDMHRILEEAAQFEDIDNFEKEDLRVPYKTDELRSYTLRFREAWPLVHRLLEDEELRGKIQLYPEKRFIKRPNGNGNMRVINEVWTADDWDEMQATVGKDRVVINITIYADATQLNAFGTHKAWTMYGWLNNFSRTIRRTRGKGGAFLLAFLPSVPGLKHDDSSHLATHRARVYHAAAKKVVESMEIPAKYGAIFDCEHCGKMVEVMGHPCVTCFSMDLEEKYRAAGLLGTQSKYVCPICLVPHDNLNNFRGSWPARSQQSASALIQEASTLPTQKDRREKLASQSLRLISNAFFGVCGYVFDLYRAFAADPLHEIEQGVYGKHIWPWILEHILDKDMQDHVDAHFIALPPFPRIHHFPNGVTSLQYITAREHSTILRYLAPAITGLITAQEHLILPLIRHLACVLVLVRFESHTDDTLALLEEKIQLFGHFAQAVEDAGLEISFNFPKYHTTMKHMVDHIHAKGTVDNYGTDLGEALHPQTKRDWRRSNHQPATAEDQMLRMARERDIIMQVQARIDAAQERAMFQSAEEAQAPGKQAAKAIGPAAPHLILGAPQRSIRVNAYAKQLKDDGINIPQFHDHLMQFLRRHLAKSSIPDNVVPHRALRVTYICQVSAEHKIDIIHVSPNWRNTSSRHDHAMIQGARPSKPMFAELSAMFTLDVLGTVYKIGIVKFYGHLGRHLLSDYIQLERLVSYEFIFLGTIIRAVHILPPTAFYARSIVQDLVDGDMYLRLINTK
ncbi:hypothetical protein NM688_g4302 [Phlebia brevispora]|uniref:Uncharacterized protein n=1 Tax=Phlebia brevispora TaxID=194682 RepID=A0ACC1T3H8_9APHY|nr:hypothetical protein NM688_g4302 [Phlebia brevispora]